MNQLLLIFCFFPIMLFAQNPENQSKSYEYILCSTKIKILVFEKSNPHKITYFNLHDNENTSVEAAKAILAKNYSGKLVELQHNGERLIKFDYQGLSYQIDPNRMFTKIGIEKNLRTNGNYSEAVRDLVFEFGKKIYQDFLQDSRLIVAMHNNKNSAIFSIKSYQKGGNFESDASRFYYNPKMGTGDFFYVIDNQYFNFFKNKKISVVLQNPQTVSDDGSLSVFCQNQQIPYLNSEAEHGHLAAQIKLLEVLQGLIKKRF